MMSRACTVDPDAAVVSALVALGLVKPSPTGPVVDARGALGDRTMRQLIVSELVRHAREVAPDVVGGIANSGSAWGLLVADSLGVPFVNVLEAPREKGLARQLEPSDTCGGRHVLLIDNWSMSGASVESAVGVVLRHGASGATALMVSAPETLPRVSVPMHVALPIGTLGAS